MIFTEAELRYLVEHPLGRLATIGSEGAPQVNPVTFRVNPGTGTVDIGGPAFSASRKFRNVQGNPHVSFVIDDAAEEPNVFGQRGRGVEVRGEARIVTLDPPLMAMFDAETIRIHPRRIVAWNIDGVGYNARDVV
ncbi:PPOX class F420-dependent oxidoreductase [Microtetraspora sp. AC03309]|uniref:PPOX class F420-dependent oxidoreductase n=1 Tax=Microtetraspora sp. AC03309 TaxID=2779376 RepID=UPI001E51ED64|nr:PPOX class F420-dependent oxidoreductase [Microtetraspora sp. AC03309]MCC5578028.1 PPOX class F420-dependent oxidoreductase [Microtetraspora sp. AC03309]